jgi:SAM-dependent methyltransferase
MEQMDITAIPRPDACFDAILCSHVLEHVPDDHRAMRELARILKPDGWALFMVPMKRETTIEDPSITDPVERDRLFGHPEHVRRYGLDIADRLTEAGFDCRRLQVGDVVSESEAIRMGLEERADRGGLWGNGMFECVKQGRFARTGCTKR